MSQNNKPLQRLMPMKSKTKNFFNSWQWTIIIVVLIIAGVSVFVNLHPYTISFTMDDNTLEAMKTINWTELTNG